MDVDPLSHHRPTSWATSSTPQKPHFRGSERNGGEREGKWLRTPGLEEYRDQAKPPAPQAGQQPSEYARFSRTGWRVTGQPRGSSQLRDLPWLHSRSAACSRYTQSLQPGLEINGINKGKRQEREQTFPPWFRRAFSPCPGHHSLQATGEGTVQGVLHVEAPCQGRKRLQRLAKESWR